MTNNLITTFKKLFSNNNNEIRTFFSPGRINLIGEHTDYNGGHVFPCAITLGTYGVVRKREDNKLRFYSMNFEETGMIECSLDNLAYRKEDNWTNYPKGVIKYIKESHEISHGFDILVYGTIPNGAGLSSSASLELLIGTMVNTIYSLQMETIELVKIGKRVENEFIGVNSGIMDQFAIGMGKEDCAILLDCNTLKYEYAPIKLQDYQIIIMNTNKRRELTDSKYNERRQECEVALSLLQNQLNIQSLGELTVEEFEENKYLINNKILEKRARHAVSENQRTLEAYIALGNGNLKQFGQFMNDSHVSLKTDYEVTGIELDTLVATAWKHQGTLGARMTGAGFGGCAIAIVENHCVDSFIEEVGNKYKEQIGYGATFYVASIGSGTKEIIMEE